MADVSGDGTETATGSAASAQQPDQPLYLRFGLGSMVAIAEGTKTGTIANGP